MTRLARRALLLVALSALTATATAYAECAWVVWEKNELYRPDDVSTTWKIQVARQDQPQCEDVLRRLWEAELKHLQSSSDSPGVKEVKSAPGYISVTFKSDLWATHEFLCLPDTVDPRGPKAK